MSRVKTGAKENERLFNDFLHDATGQAQEDSQKPIFT